MLLRVILLVGAVLPHVSKGPFLYVNTSSRQAEAFAAYVASCQNETRAFASVVASISPDNPLRTQVWDSIGTIMFGTPADLTSNEPLLGIDLRDLDRLPVVADVRRWGADSSWAWTRCEVLAHEIAEAVAYREQWEKRPAGETLRGANAWFGERRRTPHLKGLQAEDEVASEQRTRLRSDGTPYSRTRECFASKGVVLVFGPNTEVLISQGPGPIRFLYYPNQDLCASL